MSINNLLNIFPDKYIISFTINKEKKISLSNTEEKNLKEKIEISKGIHNIYVEYNGKVDASKVEEEIIELISAINPLEMLEIFSKNFIHDVKGPSNLSLSAITLEKEGKISKDQMLQIIKSNMDELSNSIKTNKAIIDNKSTNSISKRELENKINKLSKNYPDIIFDIFLDLKDIKESLLEILILLFNNLFYEYSGNTKISIENVNEKTKILITLDKNISSELIESLILFRNKKMFHSLGFLRFISNGIAIKENSIILSLD